MQNATQNRVMLALLSCLLAVVCTASLVGCGTSSGNTLSESIDGSSAKATARR
jgi:hypothetical protein